MTTKVHVIKRGRTTVGTRCVHFAGVNMTDPEKRCKAGVLMADVIVREPYRYRYAEGGPVYTSSFAAPCIKRRDPEGRCSCERREFPTPEQAEAQLREINESFERVAKARSAIVGETGGKVGVSGTIDCPVCESGTLGYSVAALNGHIHAGCSTKGCVQWME